MFVSDLLIQLQDILIKLAADLSVFCYKFQTAQPVIYKLSYNFKRMDMRETVLSYSILKMFILDHSAYSLLNNTYLNEWLSRLRPKPQLEFLELSFITVPQSVSMPCRLKVWSALAIKAVRHKNVLFENFA